MSLEEQITTLVKAAQFRETMKLGDVDSTLLGYPFRINRTRDWENYLGQTEGEAYPGAMIVYFVTDCNCHPDVKHLFNRAFTPEEITRCEEFGEEVKCVEAGFESVFAYVMDHAAEVVARKHLDTTRFNEVYHIAEEYIVYAQYGIGLTGDASVSEYVSEALRLFYLMSGHTLSCIRKATIESTAAHALAVVRACMEAIKSTDQTLKHQLCLSVLNSFRGIANYLEQSDMFDIVYDKFIEILKEQGIRYVPLKDK